MTITLLNKGINWTALASLTFAIPVAIAILAFTLARALLVIAVTKHMP